MSFPHVKSNYISRLVKPPMPPKCRQAPRRSRRQGAGHSGPDPPPHRAAPRKKKKVHRYPPSRNDVAAAPQHLTMSPPSPCPLSASLLTALQRRRQKSSFRQLTLARPGTVDFSSNDFISLSTSPVFRQALLAELGSLNDRPLGSGGSRLLDGNSVYAEQLETQIAGFLRGEAGLLFNSGFDANAGFFACVPQPGDAVVYDELIHASVHEGMRLSRAERKRAFRHNDVGSLRAVLREMREAGGNVFVAVETLYSMDGDLAPLKEIVGVIEEVFEGKNGYLVVDEAHSTGVYGEKGRGLVCELALEKKVFARLHTFGKSLACNGGEIIVGEVVEECLLMSRNSYHALLASGARISYQLRPDSDIYHGPIYACPRRYQGRIHAAPERRDRRCLLSSGPPSCPGHPESKRSVVARLNDAYIQRSHTFMASSLHCQKAPYWLCRMRM
jgi:hypothetical protein